MKRRESRKKKRTLQQKRAITGYLFILPFVIGFLAFMAKPIINSLYLSFCRIETTKDRYLYFFEGIQNYRYLFLEDATFLRSLTEVLSQSFVICIPIIVFSFFAAVLLNNKFRGRLFIRAVFVLPLILSAGVLESKMQTAYSSNNVRVMVETRDDDDSTANIGSITDALENMLKTATGGIAPNAMAIVFQIINSVYSITMASGVQILVFLSALQSVPSSMYEAADMDGCTAWEKLWKITFPLISPPFLVNWIYTVIAYFTYKGPISKKITDFRLEFEYGKAASVSWVYFLIVIIFIGISTLIISKGIFYDE